MTVPVISKLSLRAKIAFCVGVSILLISLAVALFTVRLMTTELRAELEERGRSIALSLESRSVDHILRGNFFDLHQVVQETRSVNKNVRYIFILDPKGNVIDHTFESGFPVDLRSLTSLESGQQYRTQLLHTEEGFIRDIAVPVFDGKAGVLHVGMAETYISSAITQTLFKLLLASGVALLVGIALSWFLVGFITRPVRRLANVADAVRGGDLASRASITTQDEIGSLGKAFDAMTEELATNIKELQASNLRLSALNELANLVSKMGQIDDMLGKILEKLAALVQTDATGILFGSDEKGLSYSAHMGFSQAYLESVAALVVSRSKQERECILSEAEYPASQLKPVEPRLLSLIEKEGLYTFASAPFLVKGEMAGALHIGRRVEQPFTPRELELLSSVAAQTGTMLTNRQLLREASEADALRQLNQMKSDFAIRASHELRTPATVLKGYIETLLRPDMDLEPSDQKQMLEDMNDMSDRLNRLIQDVLDVARIDSRTQGIKKNKVALRTLVQRVCRRFSRQSSRHHFEVDLDDAVSYVLGDADRLEDVLENLVSNALKFSSEGTTVTVSAKLGSSTEGCEDLKNGNSPELMAQPARFVIVSVTDEGIGIPADEVSKVFQQFYQVPDNNNTKSGGIGVGLFICRSYVEAMGGKIWVKSDRGKGSTFSFTIPAIESLRKQTHKRTASLARQRR